MPQTPTDPSSLGTPILFSESLRTFLEQTLLEKRTETELDSHPQEALYLVNTLTKVEQATGGGQVTLTENENRYLQQILREQETIFQALFEPTQQQRCTDVLTLLTQSVFTPS